MEAPNSFRSLANRATIKQIDFMGTKVTISKLTGSEVKEIRKIAKEQEKHAKEALKRRQENPDAEVEELDDEFAILHHVIRTKVEGAQDMTTEDFDAFPMDDLKNLSQAIMQFSGLNEEPGK